MSALPPPRPQDVPGRAQEAGASGGADPPESPNSARPTYAKRGKITIVACMPCRKRKTKCDGRRPLCSQCISRESQCQYDMTDDQRKLTYLRETVDALETKTNVLESLLRTVQNSNEEEAQEIVRRLRNGTDIKTVADQVQAGQVLSGVRQQSPLSMSPVTYSPHPYDNHQRSRLQQYELLMKTIASSNTDSSNEIVQRIRNRDDVESILNAAQAGKLAPQPLITKTTEIPVELEAEYARLERTFSMINHPDVASTHVRPSHGSEFQIGDYTGPWTSVTQDQDFIEHLLTLYFTWQHSFFQSFPEKLFRSDMKAGRTKFCSSMLVNAICAAACFLSNRPKAHQDRGDGQTIVSSFFDEALRLLNETEASSITATATMYLLSYIEGTRGRLSQLWNFSGRSALMALDINLHLRHIPRQMLESVEDEENEKRARLYAFWGCFHVDQTTSFTLGRTPNINIHSVTVDLPPIDEEEDTEPWEAYEIQLENRPGARSTTFRQCASLSRIVNRTLLLFFAPSVALTGPQLLNFYQLYCDWYDDLPLNVKATKDAPPHVLCLHIYYHTAVLLLFRPFLKATLTNSDVVPREVCRQAANSISDIWAEHRRLYQLTGIYMFQVHCLLTACTIHIVNVPAVSATNYLTEACNNFQELVSRNEWARTSLVILRSLVKKWDRVLPQEAEEALYRDDGRPHRHLRQLETPAQPLDQQGMSSAYSNLVGTADLTFQVEDKPGPSHTPSKRNSVVSPSFEPSTSQKRQRLVIPPTPENFSKPASPAFSVKSVPATIKTHDAQYPTNYLYAPLADQPAPLLAPVHGVNTRSQSSVGGEQRKGSGAGDEVNRIANGVEGLSFGDDWRDPFMGYGGDTT